MVLRGLTGEGEDLAVAPRISPWGTELDAGRERNSRLCCFGEESENNHADNLQRRAPGTLLTNLVGLRQVITAAFPVPVSSAASPREAAFIGKSGFSSLLAELRGGRQV